LPKGVYPRKVIPWPDRFWAKVDVRGPDECWEWQAHRDPRGYGTFRIGNAREETKPRWAHRLAWELTNGPIPDGLCACHRCDNPPCCNPGHLFIGTRGDNNRDAAAKGRTLSGERHPSHTHPESWPRGQAHPNSTLTKELVVVIRTRAAAGESQTSIGADLGVKPSTVGAVVRRENWRHVEVPT
jgi:hypothetical protein